MQTYAVNECLQHEIGFGRYQWELFILSGFGWMADSKLGVLFENISDLYAIHRFMASRRRSYPSASPGGVQSNKSRICHALPLCWIDYRRDNLGKSGGRDWP